MLKRIESPTLTAVMVIVGIILVYIALRRVVELADRGSLDMGGAAACGRVVGRGMGRGSGGEPRYRERERGAGGGYADELGDA